MVIVCVVRLYKAALLQPCVSETCSSPALLSRNRKLARVNAVGNGSAVCLNKGNVRLHRKATELRHINSGTLRTALGTHIKECLFPLDAIHYQYGNVRF